MIKRAENKHPILQLVLFSLLIFAILFLDIFGLGTATDNASRQAFLKIIAPFHTVSARDARDKIVVITISDTDLPTLANKPGHQWPLDYADQADLLAVIIETNPKVIFWDFFIPEINERDTGFSKLESLLRATVAAGTPKLIFADALQGINSPPAETKAAKDTHANRIITVAPQIAATGVTISPSSWRSEAYRYPLYINTQTLDPATTETGLHVKPSAATEIYRILNPDNAKSSGSPMTVIWGNDTAPSYSEEEEKAHNCPAATSAWGIPGYIAQAFSGPKNINSSWLQPNPCFFHNHYSAKRFLNLYNGMDPSTDIFSALEGKAVFVGGNIAAIPDMYVSPINGPVPAVMLHAAALDNLLTYKNEYPREPKRHKWLSLEIDIAEITEITFMLFALIFSAKAREKRSYILAHPYAKLLYLAALLTGFIVLFVMILIMFYSYNNIVPVNWVVLLSISLMAVAPKSQTVTNACAAFLRLR